MAFTLKKDPTKYQICATGAGWENAPKESNSIIYCLNDYIHVQKYGVDFDMLFMLDVLDEKPQIVSGQDNLVSMIKKINATQKPFVGPYRYHEIPLSQAFPLKECVKEFGMPYFSNTVGYMIAYALLQGAREIQLWGINQAGSHEYSEERPSVEYWIGIAVGRGVKVVINGKDSQLLKFKGRYGNNMLYGYLQPYEEILRADEKYGETVIRKLLAPQPNVSRTVRVIN